MRGRGRCSYGGRSVSTGNESVTAMSACRMRCAERGRALSRRDWRVQSHRTIVDRELRAPRRPKRVRPVRRAQFVGEKVKETREGLCHVLCSPHAHGPVPQYSVACRATALAGDRGRRRVAVWSAHTAHRTPQCADARPHRRLHSRGRECGVWSVDELELEVRAIYK